MRRLAISAQAGVSRTPVAMLPFVVAKLSLRILGFALEERHEVVAVEMDLEGLAAGGKAGLHLFLDVRNARGGAQRREPVDQRDDLVVLAPGLHDARPADHHRDAEAAFPGRAFLA